MVKPVIFTNTMDQKTRTSMQQVSIAIHSIVTIKFIFQNPSISLTTTAHSINLLVLILSDIYQFVCLLNTNIPTIRMLCQKIKKREYLNLRKYIDTFWLNYICRLSTILPMLQVYIVKMLKQRIYTFVSVSTNKYVYEKGSRCHQI